MHTVKNSMYFLMWYCRMDQWSFHQVTLLCSFIHESDLLPWFTIAQGSGFWPLFYTWTLPVESTVKINTLGVLCLSGRIPDVAGISRSDVSVKGLIWLPKMSIAGGRQMVLERGHGYGMRRHSVSPANSSTLCLLPSPYSYGLAHGFFLLLTSSRCLTSLNFCLLGPWISRVF